ncbi:glycine cleavage system protein GcvH [Iocasia frigidifontis]|uniref:Glycine cleavage system H protein n=1 Tax=Iocasia fonsfrigidae TaxID=2682810 RepID=A0A8A7KDC1_9FIRM|nr:glycine cleavage system protein GcvH [Iocasia fonsfrigidae]QTL99853.1 glycine cleavage system protein GcvH [Iocasia fonsfrigidae]
MLLPKDLYYTENHEWIFVEGKKGTIGVTEHAQKEMGDIVFVELPEIGDNFEQFDSFAVIESVKAVSDVYLPVGGKVIAINQDILEQPELVNDEPIESGWLVEIEISNLDELESLMDDEAYAHYLEEGK